jgi:hypothetical protein
MCFSSWSFSVWLEMEANCIPWYLQYWADLYQLACRFPGNRTKKPPVSACADKNALNKIIYQNLYNKNREHFVPQKQFAQKRSSVQSKVSEIESKRQAEFIQETVVLFWRWLCFWGTNLGRQSSPAAVCSPPRCRWRRDACRGSGSSD